MDYADDNMVSLAYWGSNVVGLAFLLAAYKRPRLARLMFTLLFGYAFWINYNLSRTAPEAYLTYAEHAAGMYTIFIEGWFSRHITGFVTFIAVGQLLIAVGMTLNRYWVSLAGAGAIIFLMAIAPLGYYSAFPFSLTVSFAAYLITRSDDKDYLWKSLNVLSSRSKKERAVV